MNRQRLVAVVGPTATGKSELGVELAVRLGGEVINADAMQLYRGMDIGTAKLTEPERRGVPHHLLDVLEVTQPASVAAFQRDAQACVARVVAAGRVPVLVGGSGLYVQAVLDDLRFPGTDPAVRARLEAELAEIGPAELHRRLAERDPAAALAVLPSNGRRIVRALEVIEITGQPFTARLTRSPASRADAVVLGLDLPSDALDARIERRVAKMFATGLVAEVRGLVGRGLRQGRTASRALGYRQVLSALDAGGGTGESGGAAMAGAQRDTVQATRRFVRRQRSWFRRDPSVQWLDAAGEDLADIAVRRYRGDT